MRTQAFRKCNQPSAPQKDSREVRSVSTNHHASLDVAPQVRSPWMPSLRPGGPVSIEWWWGPCQTFSLHFKNDTVNMIHNCRRWVNHGTRYLIMHDHACLTGPGGRNIVASFEWIRWFWVCVDFENLTGREGSGRGLVRRSSASSITLWTTSVSGSCYRILQTKWPWRVSQLC